MRTSWRLLRAYPGLRRVVGAGLVSLTGDWVLTIGLAYLVYAHTGSTLASGATLLAAYGPQIVLGSLAGVFVDRWDRRRTMVCVNLLQAAGLLPLLAVSPHRIWPVYVVALFEGCVEQFFGPAEQALVPSLVDTDDLLAANAVNGQNRDVARLVGSFAGGVLAAAGGVAAVALFDAATFLVSALLVAGVRVPPVARVAVAHRLAGEWRAGLRVIAGDRGLRTVLVFALVTSTGEGVMGTLMAPWVHDVVHGDGRAYGLILGVQAVGGIAGGLVAASVAGRLGARAMFGWGAVTFGAFDLVLFTYPVIWPYVAPAIVVIAFVGVPGAIAVAGRATVLQTLTDDRFRGRVFGAIGAVQAVAAVAGIGAAAWLGDAVGILPVIAWQGVGYMLGGALVLAALRPAVSAAGAGL